MAGLHRWSIVDTIRSHRVSASHVIALSGLALIGIGVFLPWVGDTQLRVYVLGMESGFERQWGKRLLLGAALGLALVVVTLTSRQRSSIIWATLGGIGLGTVLVTVATTPLTDQAPPPPAIGIFVTLAGGLLVAGAAIGSLIGTYRQRS